MSYESDPRDNLVSLRGRDGTSNVILKLTYQDLADLFGVSRKTISNWFSSKKLVRPRQSLKGSNKKFLLSLIKLACSENVRSKHVLAPQNAYQPS